MPKTMILDNLGSTGLKQSGGYVYEEWLQRLRGKFAERVYREMADNSAVIGAFLYAIENLIRTVEWRIEPADESDTAKDWAQFVEGCIEDMSQTWDDFISDALSMLAYGYSYHESIYKIRRGPLQKDPRFRSKYDDGLIGWRKLPIRGQDTLENWEFDDDGGIRGRWQSDPWSTKGMVFLPIEKCLLFRTKATKGNPEGRSILRNAVRSWWFLKRLQEQEAIGIERDLSGYPVIEVPPEILAPGATPAQQAIRAELEKLVSQIKRDEREGALMPSEVDPDSGKPTGYKLKLLTTGGRRQVDSNTIIVRYEQRIAMTVLAEFIMLGLDRVGSYSLADSKTHLFAVALGATMDSIADVFNRFAIPRLMRLNKVPAEYDPYLVHGDIETPNLDILGKFLQSLSSTGILGSGTALERKMREVGDLPQEED